jgi:hypothetical protein
MLAADNPENNFVTRVIDHDETISGIRFPKGSKVSTLYGKLSTIVLSQGIAINGIPAGKGANVGFRSDGTVGYFTTGRAWSYRGIPVPVGSIIFLSPGGIYELVLSQQSNQVIHVEDMLVRGTATLQFDGERLRALNGHYEWHGGHYKTYRVDPDGRVLRVSE